MQSKATTVERYLAELSGERRAAIQAVREVILANLDDGYEEGMQYGMIGYYVPLRLYPAGYHCNPELPLGFASLASQKNHMSLGIMSNYGGSDEERRSRAAWAKTGKKLDMGKCCVRFRKLEDVPLEVVGESIRRMPVKKYIEFYEKALLSMNKHTAVRSAKRKEGRVARAPKSAAGKAPAVGGRAGKGRRAAAR